MPSADSEARSRISLLRVAFAFLVFLTAMGAILAAARTSFVLSSPDPKLLMDMPDEYTANAFGCSGGNQSPALEWHGAPAGTKSFVVTLFDRDERSTRSGWWHWVMYDLPPDTNKLEIGAGAAHSPLLPK